MHTYDPEQAPNPAEWLAFDEQQRIDQVVAYHRKARIKLPSIKAHAAFHAIVENQIAEGHAPVVRAMARLMSGGLSRHDALHAVGAVLAEHVYALFNGDADDAGPMVAYDAAVERLTAEGWLHDHP